MGSQPRSWLPFTSKKGIEMEDEVEQFKTLVPVGGHFHNFVIDLKRTAQECGSQSGTGVPHSTFLLDVRLFG